MLELLEQKSAHEAALENFEQAADALELPAGTRSRLREPEDVLHRRVPIAMSNSRIEQCDAWCIRHNTSRGPARGGFRYHPGLTLDTVTAEAMFMTWRWAVLDIPFGGGRGGVAVGIGNLPPADADSLACQTLEIVPPALARGRDGVKTPRETSLGTDASARGAFCVAEAACEYLGIPLANAVVAVHGFGHTGSGAAALLARAGASVVAANDSRGTIFRAGGLNIPGLIRHKQLSGSVVGFEGAEPVTVCDLFALDCDILIASAIEGTVRGRNAPAIRSRIVVEAADGSLTRKADSILHANRVLVVPDMVANAGRDAAAFYESIGEPCADARLRRDLRSTFSELTVIARDRGVTMREASYLLAVKRVAESIGRPAAGSRREFSKSN